MDHPRGVSLWLTQRSSSARRWNPPNDFLSLPGDHEHPAADPRQVFFHSAISHYPFAPGNHTWQAPRHNDSILLKDRHGRTYLMSIADGADGTFMLEAASRCPKILFGDSHSFHAYDAFKHIQCAAQMTTIDRLLAGKHDGSYRDKENRVYCPFAQSLGRSSTPRPRPTASAATAQSAGGSSARATQVATSCKQPFSHG